MPDAGEQRVVIFPDSTGKAVRTLQVTTLVDGLETTTQMQVVALSDAAGNVLRFFEDREFEVLLLEQLARLEHLLLAVVEQ